MAISTQKLPNHSACALFHTGCGDCASVTGGKSALNLAFRFRLRRSTSVRLSCLGCLRLSRGLPACSPAVGFPCIPPLRAQLRSATAGT